MNFALAEMPLPLRFRPETPMSDGDLMRFCAASRRDQERFVPLCPDFVIELRSPSDNPAELKEKMERWIANGAQLAWLIDPIEEAVSVNRPGESSEVHHHPTSVQGHGPIAGFELVMARIWN
jgi:Uma2 family endonuclease